MADIRMDSRLNELLKEYDAAETHEELDRLVERMKKRAKVIGMPESDLMALIHCLEKAE